MECRCGECACHRCPSPLTSTFLFVTIAIYHIRIYYTGIGMRTKIECDKNNEKLNFLSLLRWRLAIGDGWKSVSIFSRSPSIWLAEYCARRVLFKWTSNRLISKCKRVIGVSMHKHPFVTYANVGHAETRRVVEQAGNSGRQSKLVRVMCVCARFVRQFIAISLLPQSGTRHEAYPHACMTERVVCRLNISRYFMSVMCAHRNISIFLYFFHSRCCRYRRVVVVVAVDAV